MVAAIFAFLFACKHITAWMEAQMLPCPFKTYLHVECPGCGLQRSLLALIRGELLTSLRLYPAALPMMMLVLFTLLHLQWRFTRGATIIKYSYTGIAIIVAVFYIYKVICL